MCGTCPPCCGAPSAAVSADELGKLLVWVWLGSAAGVTRALFFNRVVKTGQRRRNISRRPSQTLTSPLETGTFSGQVLGGRHGFSSQAAHHVVHRCLMTQKNGPNHFVVDDLGAVPGDWSHAPQQEETLREEVG